MDHTLFMRSILVTSARWLLEGSKKEDGNKKMFSLFPASKWVPKAPRKYRNSKTNGMSTRRDMQTNLHLVRSFFTAASKLSGLRINWRCCGSTNRPTQNKCARKKDLASLIFHFSCIQNGAREWRFWHRTGGRCWAANLMFSKGKINHEHRTSVHILLWISSEMLQPCAKKKLNSRRIISRRVRIRQTNFVSARTQLPKYRTFLSMRKLTVKTSKLQAFYRSHVW